MLSLMTNNIAFRWELIGFDVIIKNNNSIDTSQWLAEVLQLFDHKTVMPESPQSDSIIYVVLNVH